MKYVKRSAWGARYGRGPTNITPSRGGVTIHYEGGGKLTGQPHSKCAARVRSIENYHVNGNKWAGIAYTLLVCEHGVVFEGRGLGHRTAANGTTAGNQNYYAVCALIGDKDPLTDALLHGLRDAIDYLRAHGAGKRINGHRDHLSTSCPGSRLYAWVGKGAPRPGGQAPKPDPAPDKPSTQAPPWPGRLLTQPPVMSGDDVRQWQRRMKDRGWRITVDKWYGPASEAVCRAFQEEKGLTVDGVVGKRTWAAAWTAPVT